MWGCWHACNNTDVLKAISGNKDDKSDNTSPRDQEQVPPEVKPYGQFVREKEESQMQGKATADAISPGYR